MFGFFSQPAQTGPACEVQELKEAIEKGDLALVDVRETFEYDQGHVPMALHIPLGELEKRAGEIAAGKPVYVMCQAGGRSLKAQQKLQALGREDAVNVKGGFQAWARAGFPVEAKRRSC